MSLFSNLFSTKRQPQEAITTMLDLVTYIAGLASNPTEIDSLLDTVRSITANLGPDKTLSDSDTQNLLRIYLQIEHYLITNEPIRVFTKDSLRQRIGPELKAQLETFETKGGEI